MVSTASWLTVLWAFSINFWPIFQVANLPFIVQSKTCTHERWNTEYYSSIFSKIRLGTLSVVPTCSQICLAKNLSVFCQMSLYKEESYMWSSCVRIMMCNPVINVTFYLDHKIRVPSVELVKLSLQNCIHKSKSINEITIAFK